MSNRFIRYQRAEASVTKSITIKTFNYHLKLLNRYKERIIRKSTFIFAHGAGANSSSEFMQTMAGLINHCQIEIELFDFPYMERRKITGKKSPPDRMNLLIDAFVERINAIKSKEPSELIFIGGKSMGGRVASMIADEANVAGVVCFGYPFHPPGKPEKLRTEHLETIESPCLIIHGTRDYFGRPEEVAQYKLSSKVKLDWIEDGNHNLETLKRSSLTTEQSWQLAATKAQQFILSHMK